MNTTGNGNREVCTAKLYDVEKPPKKIQKVSKKEQNNREDGRTINDLRPLFLQIGRINAASGSAYLELKNTKVIAAVYGPRQTVKTQSSFSANGRLTCHIKYATFASKNERKDYIQDEYEQELSQTVQDALKISVILEKFPKSIVEIFFIILEDDGGILSSCINCGSLALANAGIEMYDIVTSCSMGKNSNPKDPIWLDPSLKEEQEQSSTITIAAMTSLNEITMISQSGEITPKELMESTQLGLEGCSKIQNLLKDTILSGSLPKNKVS